ncbi:basic helix-loop-helix (bHLH) DNA-binding superfamily protein [Rhynchospora pubera]|uniref:Basic helix-loop-helix (BHLH) DNA-binding superfamily protein n=1 Tax=Rhynchospora pubera TaxID=906938 RepID=A0AAV8CAC5_9POAL|nr:basic helix-loop-helix (bHLH) DNA-binding superfamily protein [Rhynchospora pubera]
MKSSGSNSSGNGNEGCSSKMERKTIEKQRRMQMKSLCFKLASLVPKQPQPSSSYHLSCISSKEGGTQVDNLEEAASYITKLRSRIEKLKEVRRRISSSTANNYANANANDNDKRMGLTIGMVPIIEVRCQNPNLEVVLIINNNSYTDTSIMYPQCHKLTFYKVIRIIEEEGADVVNASLSSLADKLVYTIHSQIRNPRGGLEASRVSNRLRQWIYN